MSWPVFAKAAEIMNYLKTNIPAIDAKLGTGNPATEGTDTVFKYLKRLENSAAGWRPYSDEIKGRAVCTVKSAYTTVVSVTGKGALLGAFIDSDSQELGGIRITIDGTVVLQVPVAIQGYTSGLVSGEPYIGNSTSHYFQSRNNNYTEQLTLPHIRTITDTGTAPLGTVARRMAPIKFNSSLLIEGYRGGGSVGSGIPVTYSYYVE